MNTLETHGLVKLAVARPELTFSFRHALTHDVVYESILRKERRVLHLRVADAIVDLHSDQLGDYAPTLARHYEEAGDTNRALPYLVMAGEAALARHALPESHAFYARAFEIVDADPAVAPEEKIDMALSAAAAGINFIPGGQTLARLEAVRTEAEALENTELLARTYALLLRVRTMLDENYSNPQYRELMDRAFALGPTVRAPEVRAYLEGMMGQALRSADEYGASVQLAGGSVGPLESAGRIGEAGLNAAYAADVEASRERFAEADQWISRAGRLADASRNPGVIADVDLVRGRIAAGRGELQAAVAHTQRGIATAADANNIQCELVGNFLVADQQLRSGDPAAAISHLERTFELGAFCNAEAMVELGQAWLASARAGLGDLDSDGFARPLEMAQVGGSRSGEAAVRLQRAIAVTGGPDPQWDLAFDDFERSITLLGDIDARPDQARAIHAYANALEAAGRDDESQTQLATAMSMFDAMGIQPDAALQ